MGRNKIKYTPEEEQAIITLEIEKTLIRLKSKGIDVSSIANLLEERLDKLYRETKDASDLNLDEQVETAQKEFERLLSKLKSRKIMEGVVFTVLADKMEDRKNSYESIASRFF
jgi:hypothetical protein